MEKKSRALREQVSFIVLDGVSTITCRQCGKQATNKTHDVKNWVAMIDMDSGRVTYLCPVDFRLMLD